MYGEKGSDEWQVTTDKCKPGMTRTSRLVTLHSPLGTGSIRACNGATIELGLKVRGGERVAPQVTEVKTHEMLASSSHSRHLILIGSVLALACLFGAVRGGGAEYGRLSGMVTDTGGNPLMS